MSFPFLGTSTRVYTQYTDTGTGTTLVAEPGASYDMAPAQGAGDLTVPPPDGLWNAASDSKPAVNARAPKNAAPAAGGGTGAQ